MRQAMPPDSSLLDDESQERIARELAAYIDSMSQSLAIEMRRQAETLAAGMLQAQYPDWPEEDIWERLRARRPATLTALMERDDE